MARAGGLFPLGTRDPHTCARFPPPPLPSWWAGWRTAPGVHGAAAGHAGAPASPEGLCAHGEAAGGPSAAQGLGDPGGGGEGPAPGVVTETQSWDPVGQRGGHTTRTRAARTCREPPSAVAVLPAGPPEPGRREAVPGQPAPGAARPTAGGLLRGACPPLPHTPAGLTRALTWEPASGFHAVGTGRGGRREGWGSADRAQRGAARAPWGRGAGGRGGAHAPVQPRRRGFLRRRRQASGPSHARQAGQSLAPPPSATWAGAVGVAKRTCSWESPGHRRPRARRRLTSLLLWDAQQPAHTAGAAALGSRVRLPPVPPPALTAHLLSGGKVRASWRMGPEPRRGDEGDEGEAEARPSVFRAPPLRSPHTHFLRLWREGRACVLTCPCSRPPDDPTAVVVTPPGRFRGR